MNKQIILTASGILLIIALFAFSIPSKTIGFLKTAEIGSGLVAKQLCSSLFIQGRTVEEIWSSELGPRIDSRLNWYSATIDHKIKEVRISLFGFYRSFAGLRDDGDGGCSVLYHGEGIDKSFDTTPDPRPWPTGDAVHPEVGTIVPDYTALEKAVEAEFLPTEEGYNRGTRSVLVVHRGKLVYERHANGWNSTIPQESRSMAKTVSAALTGILIGDGKMSLSDRNLRPEWTDGRSRISVKNLLHMESGLNYIERYDEKGDPARALYASHSGADYAAQKSLRAKPGSEIKYSGGDTDILMAVAHKKSGKDNESWANFPRDVLFDPVGMDRAVFERYADGNYIGPSYMYAAAVDWARLGLLFAQKGMWEGRQILPDGWVEFMATPTNLSCRYGAHIWLRGVTEKDEPAPVLEMLGAQGQSVVIVPETKTVIVRLAWGFHRQEEMMRRMFPALDIHVPMEKAKKINGECRLD